MKSTKNIVLIHGWGAYVAKLKPLSDALTKAGWNVFVPELPGFDLPAPSKAWDVGAYSEYIYEKAGKHFKKKSFVVFGHSFGGRVALKLAERELVERIVLCAAGGLSRPHILKRKAFETASKVGKVMVESLPHSHHFKKLMYKVAREHDYEKLNGTMRATFRNVVEEDLKPLVHKISKKALILWGEEDKMTPIADAYFLHKNIKNSKLRVFKEEGHTLPYKAYKDIVGTIDSWD